MTCPDSDVIWWNLLWLFSIFGGSNLGSAEADHAYNIKVWTTEHGLPQNTVHCLLQTRDGFLWIGTAAGLAQFDGYKFTVYDKSTSPAFVSTDCLSLAEDGEGNLWVGTANGLIRRRGSAWTYFPPLKKSYARFVDSLSPRHGGGVWIGTRDGLYEFHNERLTECSNWPPKEISTNKFAKIVTCVCQTTDGTVWISNGEGVFCKSSTANDFLPVFSQPGGWRHHTAGPLLADRNKGIWWGNQFEVACWRDGQVNHLRRLSGTETLWGSAFAEDRTGSIWIGTSGIWMGTVGDGLYCLEKGRLEKVPGLALEHTGVSSILADRAGNIWVGTAKVGLACFQPRRLSTYSKGSGLGNDDVWSIAEGADKSVWIGTAGGVSQWVQGVFTNFSLPVNPGRNPVFVDRAGDIWAAGMMCRFQDGRFSRPTREPYPRIGAGVSSVCQDRTGSIWLASDRALLRYREGELITVYSTNLHEGLIVGLLEDRVGRIWFGSDGAGLHCFEQGNIRTYTARDGLTSDIISPMLCEIDGTIWCGSDNGLNRFKDGKFSKITQKEGLWDSLALSLLEDDFGWFWINCNRGIYRVRKQDLNDFIDKKISRVMCFAYTEADGMQSGEGNGGSCPSSCKTTDGKLWFPTTAGVVVIDPRIATGTNVLPVLLQSVLADGQAVESSRQNQSPEIRLAPGKARVLEFDYTAVDLTAPHKVRFQYQLEGQDPTWVDAGDRRLALYSNLRPGSYRFLVRAVDGDGNWGNLQNPVSLVLAPHFYQTWPFYTLCGLSLLLMGGAFTAHRLRAQRTILRLERARALGEQRSRLARDMHDDVGASLTQIHILSRLAEKDAAQPAQLQQYIRKLSAISERVTREMDEMVWTVNPSNDKLAELVGYITTHAEEFLHAAGLRCRLDIPERLPELPIESEMRHSLFLVVKEALHNVVKHASATEVRIRFAMESQHLEITIADNGGGFDPGILLAALTPPPIPAGNGDRRHGRQGKGLINMRGRVGELGGKCTWDTGISRGTKLIVRVPLPR